MEKKQAMCFANKSNLFLIVLLEHLATMSNGPSHPEACWSIRT